MRNPVTEKRNWVGAMAALLAAAVSVSCGSTPIRSHATSSSNSPATLSLNASSVDFGSVPVGGKKTSSLTLANSSASGGPNVTFSKVTTTGTGFSATAAALPLVLAPGQSAAITVTFTPKSAGAASGSLSITEEGATDPSTVSLTGTGVGASQLGVSPSTLSFGSVTVGSSQTKTGTLTAGSASVNVTSAAWSGQGYSVSGISFPVTVGAGQSVPFAVSFAPQTAGSSPGSISFVSNASNSPTNEIFSGTGTQSQTQTPSTHSVELAWDPSTSQVTGYYVYRGTGGGYSRLNSSLQTTTTFTDTSVQSGATYFYVTTAVDSNGTESAFSNQVAATIPATP